MSDSYQLKELANSVKNQKNLHSYLHYLKKVLLDKFKFINIGFIELKDGQDIYFFGKTEQFRNINYNTLKNSMFFLVVVVQWVLLKRIWQGIGAQPIL